MPRDPDLSNRKPHQSVTWRIHAEVILLFGWGRAILLQLAHPLVAAGVQQHSDFQGGLRDSYDRLRSTLDLMLKLTFGPRQEAERVARRINRIHDRVHGRLEEPTGPFAAGTPYSAADPPLLKWVHATLIDSFILSYQTFVGPLSAHEQDRYCYETALGAPLLGMPEGYLPADMAELRSYMRQVYANQIAVGQVARDLAHRLLYPRAPRLAWPLGWLNRLASIGLLPQPIRRGYGVGWGAADEASLRLLAGLIRPLLPITPAALRYWPEARRAYSRARRTQALPG